LIQVPKVPAANTQKTSLPAATESIHQIEKANHSGFGTKSFDFR
jgi:hypothetical protein